MQKHIIPGQIIRVLPSIFPAPLNAVERQIKELGERWVAHPSFEPLDPSFESFIERQRSRAHRAAHRAAQRGRM